MTIQPPTRTETMLALRATRRAVRIARDIAYPQTPRRGLMSGAEMTRLLAQPWEWTKHITYALPVAYIHAVEELAPSWMKWLATGCILAIVTAAIVIFKITR